jgi:uncharacterized membrane protein
MAAGSSEKEEEKEDNLLPANLNDGPLEEALSAKLAEIVPAPKKKEAARAVREVIASFQGPLPHPSILQRYDEISQGAADRIIMMAEREQVHRHSWEKRALNADVMYSMMGMLAGWTTAIAIAIGAVIAAAYGQTAVGLALAGVSATGMVWKLVQGRSQQSEKQAAAPKSKRKGTV